MHTTATPSTNPATAAATPPPVREVWDDYDFSQPHVKMANDLAERLCVGMGLLEQRLLLLAVSTIRYDDAALPTARIALSTMRRRCAPAAGGSYTRRLERACATLERRHVTLPGSAVEGPVRLVERACLRHGDGLEAPRRYVELRLHPDLAPWLLGLRDRGAYVSLPLDPILDVTSAHSAPLALLLRTRRKRDVRHYQWTFHIAELRDTLLEDARRYGRWQDFKARVLDHALDDLARAGVLTASYTLQHGSGRRVRRLTFDIDEGTPSTPTPTPQAPLRDDTTSTEAPPAANDATDDVQHNDGPTPTPPPATTRISELSPTEAIDQEVLAWYRENLSDAVYADVKQRARHAWQQGKVHNPGGYLRHLLELAHDNHGQGTSERPRVQAFKIDELANELVDEYVTARQRHVDAFLQTLDADARRLFEAEVTEACPAQQQLPGASYLYADSLARVWRASWYRVATRHLPAPHQPERLRDFKAYLASRDASDGRYHDDHEPTHRAIIAKAVSIAADDSAI